MSAMKTRIATLDDLEAVTKLFDDYRQFYGQPECLDSSRAFMSDRLQSTDSVVVVAETDRQAGFSQLYPIFSSVSAQRVYLLNDLFVAPDFRRQGVGRLLLDASRDFAAEAGALRLELATAHDNLPAQRLYESLGYVPDTTFKRYSLAIVSTAH